MKFLLQFLAILPVFVFSHEYLLFLGEYGSVRYTHNDKHLLQVDRLSPSEGVLYTHTYHYSSEGNLLSENLIGDLGEVIYEDGIIKSPYSSESFVFDEEGRLQEHRLDGILSKLTFDKAKENICRSGW